MLQSAAAADEILRGSLAYKDMSILEIIHTLCKRLNWPCEGILQGECPKDTEDGIDTQVVRLSDDGEFVYCIPRSYIRFNGARYDPYDLMYVTAIHAQQYHIYYTASATYISKVYFSICKTSIPYL